RFLPYLYTLFFNHERTGQPVMRPLWYEFPNDKLTYLIGDQYMVGSDLLVAPVVKEGVRNREVYLPAGAAWIDWWTGERMEGGKQYRVEAPLDRLPLYARAGAIVPTQEIVQHTGEMPGSPITLNIAAGIEPGRTDVSNLHQDAGDGYGYRLNEWRNIRMEHRQGTLRITRSGNFDGQRIRYLEIVGLTANPREVRGDGKKLDHTYDAARRRVRVELTDGVEEISLTR
ncbi:MAG: hypothetical protein ABI481_13580, partial [Pyrinomonadaceae bacterium]